MWGEHVFPCRGLEKRERASGPRAKTSWVLLVRLPLGAWDMLSVELSVQTRVLTPPSPHPNWLNQNGVSIGQSGRRLCHDSIGGMWTLWDLCLSPCVLDIMVS